MGLRALNDSNYLHNRFYKHLGSQRVESHCIAVVFYFVSQCDIILFKNERVGSKNEFGADKKYQNLPNAGSNFRSCSSLS